MIKRISGLPPFSPTFPTDTGTVTPASPVSRDAGAPPPGLPEAVSSMQRMQMSPRPRTANLAAPTSTTAPADPAAASKVICDFAEKVWKDYKADAGR